MICFHDERGNKKKLKEENHPSQVARNRENQAKSILYSNTEYCVLTSSKIFVFRIFRFPISDFALSFHHKE
jgi:hypothetical protein